MSAADFIEELIMLHQRQGSKELLVRALSAEQQKHLQIHKFTMQVSPSLFVIDVNSGRFKDDSETQMRLKLHAIDDRLLSLYQSREKVRRSGDAPGYIDSRIAEFHRDRETVWESLKLKN